VPLQDWVSSDSRESLVLLLVAVGAAFLVACANIANLVLARAATRTHEVGLRAALGGSRQSIFRTVLTEHAVLAALGAAGGLGVATALLRLLPFVAPPDLPRLLEVHMSWTALLAAAGLCVVATLAFGLLPALRAARTDPQRALRGDGRSTGPRGRLPQALVAVEVALSVALLITTGLLLTSLMRLESVDRGYAADHVLTAAISLPVQRYGDLGRYADNGARRRFWEALVERLEAEPEVVAAGVTSMLPLRGSNWGSFAVAEGDERPREEWLQVQYRWVSPGFFDAMGLPIHAGRAMGPLDDDRGVAVVSERIAAQLWPGDSPLGRTFGPNSAPDEETRLEVIGVVPDVHSTDLADAQIPIVYVPYWRPGAPLSTVVVRTAVEPSAVVGTLRRVVSAMDPELPLASVQTMQDVTRS
jgi:predicted permease